MSTLIRYVTLTSSATALAAGLAALPACSDQDRAGNSARTQDVPANALGSNDVSVLWPVPKTAADVGNMLKLDSTTTGGPRRVLLTKEAFDTVLSLGRGGSTVSASFAPARVYSNWRIVSFRYDPCFPRVTAASCTQELRLVAQPIETSGDVVIPHDFAIHLVYRPNLPNADLSKRLLALRKASPLDTGRFPLGEHPGLWQDAKRAVADRAYTKQWKDFLLSVVNDGTLRQTSFLGSDDGVTKWAFWLGNVERGSVSGNAIAAGGMDFGEHESFEPLRKGLASLDAPLRDLSREFVRANTTAPFFSTLSGERAFQPEEIINAALRIENPDLHTQGSTDCVSCHTATTARVATQERMMAANPALASNPGFFLDRARFPGLFAAPAGSDTRRDDTISNLGALTNLRMFGFFHRTASVSQRTINETAAVADFLNRNILGVPGGPSPTATPAPNLAVFCPTGASFDAGSKFCVQEGNAIGPFTEAMTLKCEGAGGGPSCRGLVAFTIEGRTFNVQRWGRAFAITIRGAGECPLGAARSAAHGGTCVEKVVGANGSLVENAFGPFPKPLVDKCIAFGGGDSCFFGRWNANFLKSLL